MQRTKDFIGSTIVLLIALIVLVSVPVFAHDGSDTESASDDDSTSVTTESTTETHRSGTTKTRLTARTQTKTEDSSSDDSATETESSSDDSTNDVHHRGMKLLEDLRKTHKKAKTAEERKKACESHKQGLQNKFTHITSNSEKIQAKIDSVLTKADAYKTSKNLDVPNYDTLLAAAKAAQSTSAGSIAQLKTVTPTLDCNSTSVATDVATFKAAAQTTRDNLKSYRTAVKALVKAMIDASKTTDTTEGSN